MLYKVTIEVDVMVVANSSKEAVDIAKKNGSSEVAGYGRGVANVINKIDEIPSDWKDNVPYAIDGVIETKKCKELVENPKKITESIVFKPAIDPPKEIKAERELPRIRFVR